MIKKICFTLIASFLFIVAVGQDRYMTKSGKIELNADDDHIKAVTRSANVLLDKKTGEVNFVVLIKGFEFSQAGMQEKFNNLVMESETFPSSQFKGTLDNYSSIDYSRSGRIPSPRWRRRRCWWYAGRPRWCAGSRYASPGTAGNRRRRLPGRTAPSR